MNFSQNSSMGGLLHKLAKYQSLAANANSYTKKQVYQQKVNQYAGKINMMGGTWGIDDLKTGPIIDPTTKTITFPTLIPSEIDMENNISTEFVKTYKDGLTKVLETANTIKTKISERIKILQTNFNKINFDLQQLISKFKELMDKYNKVVKDLEDLQKLPKDDVNTEIVKQLKAEKLRLENELALEKQKLVDTKQMSNSVLENLLIEVNNLITSFEPTGNQPNEYNTSTDLENIFKPSQKQTREAPS